MLYGEEARILVYSREDAKKAVDAAVAGNKAFESPAPREVIDLFHKPVTK